MIKEATLGAILFSLLTVTMAADQHQHILKGAAGSVSTHPEARRFEDPAYTYRYSAGRWEATSESPLPPARGSINTPQVTLTTASPLFQENNYFSGNLPSHIELYPQKGFWERRFDNIKFLLCCGK